MANKYNPQGVTKWYWIGSPTGITNPAAPTLAQIAAGTELACYMVPDGVSGFAVTPSEVDATSLCDTQSTSVPGLPTTENGSMVLYRASEAADTGADLMDELIADINVEGFVVKVLGGLVGPGELVDVFPSTLASVNPSGDPGGQAARYTVGFTHYDSFSINKVIVAS